MIGKARSVVHAKECLHYALLKDGALEICRANLSGDNPSELSDEFLVIQGLNRCCLNNTLRIEISPTVDDGLRLSNDDWRGIAHDFMQRMGLSENRQYIVVLHRDTPHRHLHIIANRVDFGGVAYNDSNISIRSGKVCERIAVERGLTTAIDVHLGREVALCALKDTIRVAHGLAAGRWRSESEYSAEMAGFGVEVVFNTSRSTGHISGMSYVVGGQKIKASQVGREFGYNRLFGSFVQHKQALRSCVTTSGNRFKRVGSVGAPVDVVARMFSTTSGCSEADRRREDDENNEYELKI